MVPVSDCYTAYLHCASTSASVKDAMDILDMMRHDGIAATAAGYSHVITASSAAGNPALAFSVGAPFSSVCVVRYCRLFPPVLFVQTWRWVQCAHGASLVLVAARFWAVLRGWCAAV